MKQFKAFVHNRRGFTLAETLMAVLILLLVTAIVAGGMPVAARALEKAVDASHAQVLLSTSLTALRDELATAQNISISGTTISYTDGSGLRSEITAEETGLWLTKAKSYVPDNKPLSSEDKTTEGVVTEKANATKRLLVSSQAATGMVVGYESVTYSEVNDPKGVMVFTGLNVKKGTRELASLGETYEIRVVSIVG